MRLSVAESGRPQIFELSSDKATPRRSWDPYASILTYLIGQLLDKPFQIGPLFCQSTFLNSYWPFILFRFDDCKHIFVALFPVEIIEIGQLQHLSAFSWINLHIISTTWMILTC